MRSRLRGCATTSQRRLPTASRDRARRLTVSTPRRARPAARGAATPRRSRRSSPTSRPSAGCRCPASSGRSTGLPWCTEMAAGAARQRHRRPLRRDPARGRPAGRAACGPSAPTGWAGSPRSSYAVAPRRPWLRGRGRGGRRADRRADPGARLPADRAAGGAGQHRLAPGGREGRVQLRGPAAQRRATCTAAGSTWRSGRSSPPTCARPAAAARASAVAGAVAGRNGGQLSPTIASDGGVNSPHRLPFSASRSVCATDSIGLLRAASRRPR